MKILKQSTIACAFFLYASIAAFGQTSAGTVFVNGPCMPAFSTPRPDSVLPPREPLHLPFDVTSMPNAGAPVTDWENIPTTTFDQTLPNGPPSGFSPEGAFLTTQVPDAIGPASEPEQLLDWRLDPSAMGGLTFDSFPNLTASGQDCAGGLSGSVLADLQTLMRDRDLNPYSYVFNTPSFVAFYWTPPAPERDVAAVANAPCFDSAKRSVPCPPDQDFTYSMPVSTPAPAGLAALPDVVVRNPGVGLVVPIGTGIAQEVDVGPTSALFSNLDLFDELKLNLTTKMCDAAVYAPDQDPVAALRGQLRLGKCGGTIVETPGGQSFITASHCADYLRRDGMRVFLVFDYFRQPPPFSNESRTFESKDFVEVTGRTPVLAPGSDIALIPLRAGEKEGAASTVSFAAWQDKEPLIALSFPYGVVMTPVVGEDVFVRGHSGVHATTTIDAFNNSSGSAIFDYSGRLRGIFSTMSEPRADTDWEIVADGKEGQCFKAKVHDSTEVTLGAVIVAASAILEQ